MNRRLVGFLAALLAACALLPQAALAANTTGADTDLFATVNHASTGEANILFVLDNGAAFEKSAPETCSIDSSGNVSTTTTTSLTSLSGKSAGVMQCSLYGALSSIPVTGSTSFNIAVMVFNSNGMATYSPTADSFSSACTGSNGGCVVLSLTAFNSTNKPNILKWIKGWVSSGSSDYNIKGPSSGAHGATMQEAWAFFQGKTGMSGKAYTAPTTGCNNNFVVFLGNAYANNAAPGDSGTGNDSSVPLKGLSSTSAMNASPAASTAEKTAIAGTFNAKYEIGSDAFTCTSGSSTSTTYTSSDSPTSGTYGLNWAKYMKNEAVIKTYSIGYLGPDCIPAYSTWLDLLADSGGGQFFPTKDYTTLKNALQTIFSLITSVNSVFASVSLPVSVNTQGSYLNQVYIGMFRPDATFLPKWLGNLKQYKLATVGTSLKLVDADNQQAINNNTGFISECARSYWTPTTTDTYWANGTSGTCTTVSGAAASNTPDGNVVEKGGQAYKLRAITPGNRTVKTCGTTMASCTSMIDFTTTALSTLTVSLFGDITTTSDRDLLINWARGLNNHPDGAVEINQTSTVMRASTHGDVMHSRPVAINYGNDTTTQVVVYYGSNDGMLHAVNGNQTGTITSSLSVTQPGEELWSFMPPEFYSAIQRQYENVKPVYFTESTAGNASAKDYGMDGPFTAFNGTIGGSTKYYLYTTMRRGGRAVYAFNVTTPGSPSLLWKAGCSSASLTATDCTVGSNDFSGIGQTWGSPKVFYSSVHVSGTSPLILMAGGYDSCEDTDTGTANHACTSSKGNRVYVLDGTDGSIVKEFVTAVPWTGGATRGVVGDATIVTNSAGMAQYAYIADLGGVVYRLDFTGAKTAWSMTPVAKVGCDTPGTACAANRKFMFSPSVVSTDGVTFWVLLGSGDREKPVAAHLASKTVSNYFFAIKDKPTDSAWLSGESSNCGGVSVICLASLQVIDGTTTISSTASAAISSKKGWYLTLSSTEQVVTSALTVSGNTTFSTHQPAVSASSCSNNLGTTRVYNINYADASSNNGTSNRYEHVSGDGLPPSAVAGKVLIGTESVPFCIGCSADSPLEGKKVVQGSSISRPRNRLYWYLQKN